MTPPASRKARSTVAVIGLGSIGGVVAGCLRAADRHDVIACVRQPIERLVLERPEGNVEVALRALTDPAQAGRVDWVLLCTKAQQTPLTAPWLVRFCDSSTRVAVLQNGIGHVARVTPLIGDACVVPTLVYYNGERLGADRVRLRHVAGHDLAVADEAVAVARADGAQLAEDESLRTMSTLLTYPPEAGTSMYFDRLAGRELEVEALTGAGVAAGERLRIATPLNGAFLALLRAVSDAARTG